MNLEKTFTEIGDFIDQFGTDTWMWIILVVAGLFIAAKVFRGD